MGYLVIHLFFAQLIERSYRPHLSQLPNAANNASMENATHTQMADVQPKLSATAPMPKLDNAEPTYAAQLRMPVTEDARPIAPK